MSQAQDRGRTEAQILEPEPDVKQHEHQGNTDSDQRVALHLITDGGADGLRSDAVLVDLEFFNQLIGELCALLGIEDCGLEDHFIAARDLLYLHIIVSGHLCKDRNDLFFDVREAHVLIKADTGRRASDKVKAVIEGIALLRLENAHGDKACQNHCDRDRKEDCKNLAATLLE